MLKNDIEGRKKWKKYNWMRRVRKRRLRKLREKAKKVYRQQRWSQLWKNKEWVARRCELMNIEPNKAENNLILLFKTYNLPYEYVGNFKKIIGRKCPDFVSEDETKVIELFGSYWHSEKITKENEDEHVKKRIDYFKRYGYDTLIIWENELDNYVQLLKRVREFTFNNKEK